jgi:ribonuclease E
LPFKEISKQYFQQGVAVSQARIQDAIREGQELLVQVEKEERGNKGAALTTFVSLAGRYVVLMPNNPRGGGVSRRIEGEDRAELKEALDQLEYPNGMSIIARTAGIGRSAPELQWDLNYLLKLWAAIDGAAKSGKGAFLIYQESSLVIRAIRDYFNNDIGDILIDTDDVFDQAQQFMAHVMPEHAGKVKRYRDDAPLFSRFQIEHQIESAYARMVNLPSGGAIVIDHTEALVSVDVNSARAIKGGDIEETATRTNLEAADEVARQMRLRDLGGLIVIDFIDMEESRNRREVENRLRDALRQDRARVQLGTISKFGLMEMSRQRLRPALSEGASIPCPRCGGSGHVRDTESSALQILRIIQEESLKDQTASVLCQVPVEVASFLLNEKRTEIAKIELKQRINVLVVPNKSLETPNYKLERLKHDDPRLEHIEASYKMADDMDAATSVTRRSQEPTNKQTPVLKGVLPDAPAPQIAVKAVTTSEPVDVVALPVVTPAPTAAPAPSVKGFFAWLKDLFSAPSTPQAGENIAPIALAPPLATAPASPTATTKPAVAGDDTRNPQRNEQRAPRQDGREGRGSQNRNNRHARPELRPDASPSTATAAGNERTERSERAPRDARPPRPPRPVEGLDSHTASTSESGKISTGTSNDAREPRPARPPKNGRRSERTPREEANPVAEIAVTAEAVTSPDAVATTPREPRRSRDRYGRDRGQRAERTERSRPTNPVFEPNPTPEQVNDAAVEPIAVAAVAESMPAQVSEPNTAAETSEAVMTNMPTVQDYTLPTEQLVALAQASGLQWIHSNPERVAAVQATIAAEPRPVHVPRERPAPVAINTEPLILVETRRDLHTLVLPFEQNQPNA